MDVRFSPEQEALRDSAAQIVDRLGPRSVAELDDPERADKLEAAVASAGWRELRVAEAGGAPLASGVEVAIVAEELGRRLADAPFLGPTLAAELRRLAGAPAATVPETVALDPDLGGPGRRSGRCRPLRCPGRGRTGVGLRPVAGARRRRSPAGPGPAVGRRAAHRPDPTGGRSAIRRRPLCPTASTGRSLSDDDLRTWTGLGLAVTCADLVGTMRGAIELAVGYARSRRQFGRSIGSFQAVQHLLADAYVLTEGSASVARHAAWAVDALPADAALASAAVAKAYCARAARNVCETSIQVHGGIGNTWECLAHVHLRRALFSGQLLGGTGANLDRVLAHHGIGGDDGLR